LIKTKQKPKNIRRNKKIYIVLKKDFIRKRVVEQMHSQKLLLVFLFSAIFLIIIPSFVTAGCCIYQLLGSSCEDKPSIQNCSTSPKNFTLEACSLRPECASGCCCDLNTNAGTVETNFSCAPPNIFIPNSSLINFGAHCSCGGAAYSISGRINKDLGQGITGISGAVVSAGGIKTTTNGAGDYTLTGVPGGNVLVKASKQGECLPNSVSLSNVNQDRSNINIQLNCVCAKGDCNIVMHAYCTQNNGWQTYDLHLPEQRDAYCAFCRLYDPATCVPVNPPCTSGDGSCPLVCSPTEDSDCVCSSTPNGVCPWSCSSVQGSSNYDADCKGQATCGNHLVEYPYETCEPAPDSNQVSLCLPVNCAKPGETGQCNCLGLSRCGNQVLDPGEVCESGMFCSDGNPCVACNCGPQTCVGTAVNPSLTAKFDAVNNRVIVSWYLLSSCASSVKYYSLIRCIKGKNSNACSSITEFSPIDAASLSLTIPPSQSNYSDAPVNGTLKYCYILNVSYLEDRLSSGGSGIVCVETGDAYCMNAHPAEFCYDNQRYSCDANYNLKPVSGDWDCNAGNRHCVGPDRNEKTTCINQSVCDACNGLYGMFANRLDVKVKVPGVAGDELRYCRPGAGHGLLVQGCYLDRTKTLFSAFDYCAKITSCYDYKSEVACTDPTVCEDPANICCKNQDCEWARLDDNNPALGGICRPKTLELQSCELCDDENYNWLSPGCAPEVCNLFGKCYYLGKTSGSPDAPTCTKRSVLTCLGYKNINDCIGGSAVQVDVSYDANWKRIGGTNQFIPSNDILGLGKCYWWAFGSVPTNGVCLRDADNYPVQNYDKTPGWDCPGNELSCESDFESPETKILPRASCPSNTYGVDATISYSAIDADARYPTDQLKTYFCISSPTSSCYPAELGFKGTHSITISTSGIYKLYYYSEDPAKNLEVVKSTTITVDANYPDITFTKPEGLSNLTAININQQSFNVEGIVSTDTKYVCAKNIKTYKTNCTYSCALQGITPPCISDTGNFALDISTGGVTNVTQILVSLEDFACNAYNFKLGLTPDKPLNKPNITISPYPP
jgi:hypothetical protein